MKLQLYLQTDARFFGGRGKRVSTALTNKAENLQWHPGLHHSNCPSEALAQPTSWCVSWQQGSHGDWACRRRWCWGWSGGNYGLFVLLKTGLAACQGTLLQPLHVHTSEQTHTHFLLSCSVTKGRGKVRGECELTDAPMLSLDVMRSWRLVFIWGS